MNLFNTDWKNYVSKGEKVSLMKEIPSKISLIFAVLYSFGLSIWVILGYLYIIRKHFNTSIIITGVLITIIIFTICFIYQYLKFKSMKYVITNKGILEIRGVFIKSYKFVPFVKITDTRLHRNILDLIFGTGSIDVSTAGGTRITNGNSQPYEVRFLHVYDFMKVNEQVKKSIK
ncbi:MAG: PH domain-containing protein [Alphaproteobacteria bacterium]